MRTPVCCPSYFFFILGKLAISTPLPSPPVKAMMPLFAVVLSRLILKQRHSPLVYLTLVPIVSGVIIASATELSFDLVGLLSALLACFTFALQNICTKKVLQGHSIASMQLLLEVSRASLAMLVPFWLFMDSAALLSGAITGNNVLDTERVLLGLIGNGVCNALQSVVAFTFLSLVSPVSYSVCFLHSSLSS